MRFAAPEVDERLCIRLFKLALDAETDAINMARIEGLLREEKIKLQPHPGGDVDVVTHEEHGAQHAGGLSGWSRVRKTVHRLSVIESVLLEQGWGVQMEDNDTPTGEFSLLAAAAAAATLQADDADAADARDHPRPLSKLRKSMRTTPGVRFAGADAADDDEGGLRPRLPTEKIVVQGLDRSSTRSSSFYEEAYEPTSDAACAEALSRPQMPQLAETSAPLPVEFPEFRGAE